jgi:hypothetical protein
MFSHLRLKQANKQNDDGHGFITKLTSCYSLYKNVCYHRLLSHTLFRNPRLQVVLSFMVKKEKKKKEGISGYKKGNLKINTN